MVTGFGTRLRDEREKRELTQIQLAEKAKVSQQSIQDIESGKSKTSRYLVQIAEALNLDPTWLLTGKGSKEGSVSHRKVVASGLLYREHLLRSVSVVGAVQAGVWQEAAERPTEEHYTWPMGIQPQFEGMPVFGLEVLGPSMDEIFPHGSVLSVVKFMDIGRNPRHLEHVIALRSNRDGRFECTVKQFRIGQDGRPRLWPRSRHPDFQAPILVEPEPGETLEITHLVIGAYIPTV